MAEEVKAGTGGNVYIAPDKRDSSSPSKVWFTKDLSSEGLRRVFQEFSTIGDKKVAIKLHTGEKRGPNILPRDWVKDLVSNNFPEATIVETNSYYEGDRYTTEKHRQTLNVNGWTFCPVDILDEHGETMIPVQGGKWFKEISVGKHLKDYNFLIALTHFKGHTMAGFGGSNKNLGIGCAGGRIGKAMIHTEEGKSQWSITQEEFMERMTESTKAVIDYFKDNTFFVNVMRNMSVSCDCEGIHAEPVVTPNVGILASYDILALDQACVDLIYAMDSKYNKDLVERIESRHGLRQLSYMKELDMGSDAYQLLNLDAEGNPEISLKDALLDIKPFEG